MQDGDNHLLGGLSENVATGRGDLPRLFIIDGAQRPVATNPPKVRSTAAIQRCKIHKVRKPPAALIKRDQLFSHLLFDQRYVLVLAFAVRLRLEHLLNRPEGPIIRT